MLNRLLLFLAPALPAFAGGGIYHAVEGGRQVAVACDQFARERPASPRLLIAGCEINPANAGFRESRGHVDELFLPVRPAGGRTLPAPLVGAPRAPAPPATQPLSPRRSKSLAVDAHQPTNNRSPRSRGSSTA